MVVPAAMFGASAFAAERRDRSAEFLAMMPVTRSMIVASKFCFVWAWMLLGFILSAALFFSMAITSLDGEGPGMDGLQKACIAACFLGACVQGFGIGLLMSIFFSSGAAAAAAIIWSIAAPIILGYNAPNWSVTTLFLLHATVYLGIGCITTCAGMWIYLRRVEP
jgi:ABC-type transport system involved in multi-copper enzyme maturation permease subunit